MRQMLFANIYVCLHWKRMLESETSVCLKNQIKMRNLTIIFISDDRDDWYKQLPHKSKENTSLLPLTRLFHHAYFNIPYISRPIHISPKLTRGLRDCIPLTTSLSLVSYFSISTRPKNAVTRVRTSSWNLLTSITT